jgi:hypothetical protein
LPLRGFYPSRNDKVGWWAVWFTLRFRDASHNAVIASPLGRGNPVYCVVPDARSPLRADECPIGVYSTVPVAWL